MATQYLDGSWSETLPIEEAFEHFKKALENEEKVKVRAFHVGSFEDLEKRKTEELIMDRLNKLEDIVKELSPAHLKSDIIHIPTKDDVAEITRIGICGEVIKLKDFQPCKHPGCLNHVTHPCEKCGRTAGLTRNKQRGLKM